jgi:hypothetical protein
VTPGVPQGSVLGPLLFLAYVNDIRGNIKSKIKFFADDCIVYRRTLNVYDIEKLQTDLNRLGDWAVENKMKINPNKSKAISFSKTRVKDPVNDSLRGQNIPEAKLCKYLGITIRCDLSWADLVNYTVQKAWRALHFVMRIVKRGNKNTKSLAYTSLVRPILGYGAACWVHTGNIRSDLWTAYKIRQLNLPIIREAQSGNPFCFKRFYNLCYFFYSSIFTFNIRARVVKRLIVPIIIINVPMSISNLSSDFSSDSDEILIKSFSNGLLVSDFLVIYV